MCQTAFADKVDCQVTVGVAVLSPWIAKSQGAVGLCDKSGACAKCSPCGRFDCVKCQVQSCDRVDCVSSVKCSLVTELTVCQVSSAVL